MGILSSLHHIQTSETKEHPHSLLCKLFQYNVKDVQRAFHRLESRHLISSNYIDRSTLIQVLPFRVSASLLLTSIFEDEGHYNVDWRQCLGGLVICLNGAPSFKLSLLFQMYTLAEDCVPKDSLRVVFIDVLSAALRIYRTSLKIWNPEYQDVFINIDFIVNEITSQLYCPNQDGGVSLLDIQEWAEEHPEDSGDMLDLQSTQNDTILSRQSCPNKTSPKLTNKPREYKWSPILLDDDEPTPSARSKHASCIHNGKIYLYGGKDVYIAHKELWAYQLASSRWQQLHYHGNKPGLLQDHSMVAYKGKLYVFGGEFNSALDETPLWILHLDTLHWRKPIVESEVLTPTGRRGHTAVICNRGMHIYGGYMDLMGSNSELWTFDLDHEMWHLAYSYEMVEDGPGARHDHSAVVHDGAMWIFGGLTNLNPHNDLWKWSFGTRKWTKIKCRQGPPDLAGHTAHKIQDSMLVFGGISNGVLQNDLWKFQFASQTWQKIQGGSLTPSPRVHHCMVVVPPFEIGASESSSDRSLSVPQLGDQSTAFLHSNIGPRPYSSPANIVDESSNPPHKFQNKINPLTDFSSFLQDKQLDQQQQRIQFGAVHNSNCDVDIGFDAVQYLKPVQTSPRHIYSSMCNLSSYDKYSFVSKDDGYDTDLSHINDEYPLLGGKMHKSKTVSDGISLCSADGINNGSFVREPPEPSLQKPSSFCVQDRVRLPSMGYKVERQFSDDFILDFETKTTSLNISYKDRASRISKSLESLLDEFNVEHSTQKLVNLTPVEHIHEKRRFSVQASDLVLEDIEDANLDVMPLIKDGKVTGNFGGHSQTMVTGTEVETIGHEYLPGVPIGQMQENIKNCGQGPEQKAGHDLSSGRTIQIGLTGTKKYWQSIDCDKHRTNILPDKNLPNYESHPPKYSDYSTNMSRIDSHHIHQTNKDNCYTCQKREPTLTAACYKNNDKSVTTGACRKDFLNLNEKSGDPGPSRNPRISSKTSVKKLCEIETNQIYLLGGREAEHNLEIKPLSVWQLIISNSKTEKH